MTDERKRSQRGTKNLQYCPKKGGYIERIRASHVASQFRNASFEGRIRYPEDTGVDGQHERETLSKVPSPLDPIDTEHGHMEDSADGPDHHE